MIAPKYPEVHVTLTGGDGNAFAILGAVQREMRRAGIDEAEVSAFYDEATAADYNSLLRTAMRWVNVE